MPTISSIRNELPAPSDSNNQISSSSDTTSSTSNNEPDEVPAGSSSAHGNIDISSRAQKIQKLSEEFFPAGPRSIKITPAFIDRLKEYGFISESEASSLGPAVETDSPQPAITVEELSGFIDDLSEKLKDNASDPNLVSALQKADTILNNIDGSNPPDIAINIKGIAATISHYRYSEEAQSLSSDDRSSLNQLVQALRITDKLNPEDATSSKVNEYLSVLNKTVSSPA